MNAIDMSQFTQAKSDQLNAEDFLGGPRSFTIAGVAASGSPDQPVNVRLEGEERYFRPCKTMRRIMVAVWGRDASQYVGQALTLYRDPKVTFGGMETGGIRISHMTGISEERLIVVMEKKGKKGGITIKPLQARAPSTRSPQATTPAPASDPATGAGMGAAPNGAPPATAMDWVTTTLRQIAAVETVADLAELQAKKAAKLANLAPWPNLHGDVTQAFADRLEALTAAPVDGEFGE
jgi:hypothetical protein